MRAIGQGIDICTSSISNLTLQVKAAYERHAGRQGNDVAGFMRELGFDNFGAAMTSRDSVTELFRSAIKLTHPSRLNPRQPAARKVMLAAIWTAVAARVSSTPASCLTSVPQSLLSAAGGALIYLLQEADL